MANATDPLVLQVCGTDPQNALEYLLRQRIYQTRYWKEVGFGLNVADVLEKSMAHLRSIGGSVPQNTVFLSLLLKLLQLHPEPTIMATTFLSDDAADWPYTRLLGACYLRLTARPVEIYTALEPLLADYRSIRYFRSNQWGRTTVDQFVDALLLPPSSHSYWEVTVPRLPARWILQEAGYLEPRRAADPTLHAAISRYQKPPPNEKETVPYAEAARRYLEYLLQSRGAPAVGEARPPGMQKEEEQSHPLELEKKKAVIHEEENIEKRTPKTSSKKRNYAGLFKR